MIQVHTADWLAEFFDDVDPLVPGLKGPLPLGELAAGMRTPPHLASPRPGSCSSARMSPRSSFHNRDPGSPSPPPVAGPTSPGGSVLLSLRRANSGRTRCGRGS
jgi:hypothetical protein